MARRLAARTFASRCIDLARECAPKFDRGPLPLHSHAKYGLYEIIEAYGLINTGGSVRVTLNRADEDYSPRTRYEDYQISPVLFHRESQSQTATASPTGQRYINHVARGSKVILLVRENKKDDRGESRPYFCLGPARHVSHRSDRLMQIVWELERPMPAEIYQHAKMAAG